MEPELAAPVVVIRIALCVGCLGHDPSERYRAIRCQLQPNKVGNVVQIPTQTKRREFDSVIRRREVEIQKSHCSLRRSEPLSNGTTTVVNRHHSARVRLRLVTLVTDPMSPLCRIEHSEIRRTRAVAW